MLPRTKPDADARLELRDSVNEPARARAFVAEYLATRSPGSRDDAVLLVSELVTNVIRHGALPATVSLQVTGARLHVVVADCGPPLPPQPWITDVAATSGRGLTIVAAIALAWGVATKPGQAGKQIWFELAAVS